jgi:histidyl-tRNA synthetase
LKTSGGRFTDLGYEEIILPAIWEAGTFLSKLGNPEKEAQMWTFDDRGSRRVCLVPEATGMVQELWNGGWDRTMPKPAKVYYISRCYRYERPQAGRYREFTQFGVEILGGKAPEDREFALASLRRCLDALGLAYEFKDGVKRGLGYYVEDGFEVEIASLGAQKQVAGGGRYAEGVGWAVGVDRLLLAKAR